jgi:hypothetical protein
MELVHHGMKTVLDDDWWAEARMFGFRPRALSYNADDTYNDRRVFRVAIKDIAPVRRAPSIPIFNRSHDTGLSARERVIEILKGFREGAAIPPVEVVMAKQGSPQSFKLVGGVHRLYCSLAAGFSHVPAVIGVDINALDG